MANDGGPAFPYSALTPEGPQIYGDAKGMSLRDYFAGQALAGLAESESTEIAARNAYLYADAMLTARETPEIR